MRNCLFFTLAYFISISVLADTERLVTLDKSYVVSDKYPKHEILDMPPDSSQDSIGICFAEVAAKMMQKEYCEYRKKSRPEEKILCAELPEKELFSSVDLARMQIKDGEIAPEARSNYNTTHIDGGNMINAIRFASFVVKRIANKSCVSFDKILAKTHSKSDVEATQIALWKRLENEFKKVKTEAEKLKGCSDCLNKLYQTAATEHEAWIDREFNLKKNTNLMEAFAKDTYGEFLTQFLGANKCVRASSEQVFFEPHEKVKYTHFPRDFGARTDKKTVMEKLKTVLKGGRPVALNGICYDDVKPDFCDPKKFHVVIVTGFRTVCNSQGKCRESFKVVNSRGKTWQDANDQGWIDANTMLENTVMGTGVISWFEDKQ